MLVGVLPDVDVLATPLGLTEAAWLGGHRGLTLSLAFAVLAGVLLALTIARAQPSNERTTHPAGILLGLVLGCATHLLLDVMTNYGRAVAVFAPFDWTRVRADWRPIGANLSTTPRGPIAQSVAGLANEARFV